MRRIRTILKKKLKTKKNYLDDCVGVFAAEPLRPSKDAK